AQVCPGSSSYVNLEQPADRSTTWTNVQWSIVNGTLGYTSTSSAGFQSDPGGLPATITAVATDSRGCSNSASITIPVRSIPPPVLRAMEAQVCAGASSYVNIDSPADGSTTWTNVQWSIVNGTLGYTSTSSA